MWPMLLAALNYRALCALNKTINTPKKEKKHEKKITMSIRCVYHTQLKPSAQCFEWSDLKYESKYCVFHATADGLVDLEKGQRIGAVGLFELM